MSGIGTWRQSWIDAEDTPDATDAILAFRVWNVRKGIGALPILTSWGIHSRKEAPMWSKGINRATCHRDLWDEFAFESRCGRTPNPSCRCGFWGLSDFFRLPHDRKAKIVGTCRLWGKIVVGDYGFRAEYAQVDTLFEMPKRHRRLTQRIGEVYGVPVKPFILSELPHTTHPVDLTIARHMTAIIG